MPIYAYRCAECGHSLEVIQKVSDALLTQCPSCGKPALVKQVTAAGFQLKGAGWYVTDFRDSGKKKEASKTDKSEAGAQTGETSESKSDTSPDKAAGKSTDAKSSTETKTDSKSDSSKSTPAPTVPPKPGASGGTAGGKAGGTD